MGAASEPDDGDDARHSGEDSASREQSVESERKVVTYRSRSGSRAKSQSRSPSLPKSKKKTSRSRSRSRSHHRSRKSKYRSRSKSPRKYSRTRRSKTRSRSKSRSASFSPPYRRRRSHSRSPMSSRRRHTSSRVSDNPQPNRCLGVFGLSLYTTEQQLNQIFSKYGRLERVQVIIDAKTGRSRGFCFVYYEHLEDARSAKEQCSGMEIGGRKIRVDYSITERAHTPTPGIYMGRPTYNEDRYSRRRDRYDDDYGSSRGRYRSPSPYYSRPRRSRYERSRSRSYSPRRY